MSKPGAGDASPLSPLSSWRSDRALGLVAGLVIWLALGLASGLVVGLKVGLEIGLAAGIWFGFGIVSTVAIVMVFGLVVGLTYPQWWSSSLAFAQFAASDRTPLRLMRFLEDARSRGVLRTVGPIYQFRHAQLQDRVAASDPPTAKRPGEPYLATEDAAAPAAEAPATVV